MKNVYTATFIEEDGTFYARVPNLPECITTGKSLTDAIEQITDAANLWLVTAEDHGNPLPTATAQSDMECPDGASLTMIQVDTIAYRIQNYSTLKECNEYSPFSTSESEMYFNSPFPSFSE